MWPATPLITPTSLSNASLPWNDSGTSLAVDAPCLSLAMSRFAKFNHRFDVESSIQGGKGQSKNIWKLVRSSMTVGETRRLIHISTVSQIETSLRSGAAWRSRLPREAQFWLRW